MVLLSNQILEDLKTIGDFRSHTIQQQEIKSSTFLLGLCNNCEVIASKINVESLQIKMTKYEHVTKGYILPQTFPFSVGFYQWICHMPDRLTLIENIISTIISISLIT